ncbi:LysR family transcriptional regulator [Billgrantia azerbaijanica]|nr:LysR family transcriptional regulator [Halomonas azerbaijanica]
MNKFRAMTVFVHIVDAGSLTGAAKALDTSLTSVVRSLATLEEVLGARLLNRSTRRIALTEEGREYLERCRRILTEVEEAEAALSAHQAMPSGKLTITAPVMFGRLHVGPLVSDFLGAYPDVHAELLLLDRMVDLIDEGMDLAVRIGHLPDSSLVAIPVGEMRHIVCASPAYLASHGRPEQPADLIHHRCVRFTALTPAAEWSFDTEDGTVKVPVRGALATNQVDTALDACVKGLGCSRFLSYQASSLLRDGCLERILQPFEPAAVPVNLVYPHSRLLSSRVRAFVDWAVPRLRTRLREVV